MVNYFFTFGWILLGLANCNPQAPIGDWISVSDIEKKGMSFHTEGLPLDRLALDDLTSQCESRALRCIGRWFRGFLSVFSNYRLV